jgi:spore coat polysaccharide biosynthesis predicted glycosyltransferase SpsG
VKKDCVIIAADTGPKVGLGHLGRCVAIAEGLAAVSDEKPVFYIDDPVAADWVKGRGFGTTTTLPETIPLLIADSYRASMASWREYRRRAHRLLVIDDSGDVRTKPDWVVNSSPFAHRYPYQSVSAHSLMLGPLFHPLRKEFWPERQASPGGRDLRNVLVILGGGDNRDHLGTIVDVILGTLAKVKVHIITGPYTELPRQSSAVVIHQSPRNIRRVIERCELAVSAAGQTLFELAACGIPTLATQLVSNQSPNYTGFQDLDAIVALGAIQDPKFPARLRRALRNVANDAAARQDLAARAHRVVDGNGARRVAYAIRNF